MQNCLMEITVMFSLVTIAYFALFFDMTTTFHTTEQILGDARLPFMQALSYSTAKDTSCSSSPRVYNLFIASVLSESNSPEVCGSEYDVENHVRERWETFRTGQESSCYEFALLGHDAASALLTAGSCEREDAGEALSRTYLVPLPPDEEGNPRLTKEKITKVSR